MSSFVVLIRGINVGGNNLIKMEELSKSLQKASFSNIKTILASGNIILDSNESDESLIAKKIQAIIKKDFDLSVPTLVFSSDEFLKIVSGLPPSSKSLNASEYVTFLNQNLNSSSLKIPDPNFSILKISDRAVYCSVSKDSKKTIDLMKFLESKFGKEITTRNLNTAQKLASVLKSRTRL